MYDNYLDWKSWRNEEFGRYSRSDAVYFDHELKMAGLHDIAGHNVLEIGFGNGNFAGWARARGALYFGTEVNSDLVATARDRGFAAATGTDLFVDAGLTGPLDLIVAFDVFEHIPLVELRVLLGLMKARLGAGGVIMARMPSGDSPFGRVIQYGDTTHVTVLGSSAIRQIARDAGLDVVAIRPPAFPIKGAGVIGAIRRVLVKAARGCAHAFIAKVLMGGGTPVLTPNLVLVLKKAS